MYDVHVHVHECTCRSIDSSIQISVTKLSINKFVFISVFCFVLSDPRHTLRDAFQVLQEGAHEYTFQYKLPLHLPSSFESEDTQFKGRVHYLLRAKLDSPDESIRQHRDAIFIVLSTLDLNKERKLSVGYSIFIIRYPFIY